MARKSTSKQPAHKPSTRSVRDIAQAGGVDVARATEQLMRATVASFQAPAFDRAEPARERSLASNKT